jgi:hypothetical protein
MTHSKRVEKKSVQEQEREQKLTELCKKNNVNVSSDGKWLASTSLDLSPPHVSTRVPTVTRSKLKQALSPQKKPNGGGKRQILSPPDPSLLNPFPPALRSTRHLPSHNPEHLTTSMHQQWNRSMYQLLNSSMHQPSNQESNQSHYSPFPTKL